jgi:ribosomal protein S3
MPLQQLKYQIDYYQTFIVLKRSTIGLKVWILLESYVVLK